MGSVSCLLPVSVFVQYARNSPTSGAASTAAQQHIFGSFGSANARNGAITPRGHNYSPTDLLTSGNPASTTGLLQPQQQKQEHQHQQHERSQHGERAAVLPQGNQPQCSNGNAVTACTDNTNSGMPSPPDGETAHRYDYPLEEAIREEVLGPREQRWERRKVSSGEYDSSPSTERNHAAARAGAFVEHTRGAAAAAGANADAHSGRAYPHENLQWQSRPAKRSLPLEEQTNPAMLRNNSRAYLPIADEEEDDAAADSDLSWDEDDEGMRQKSRSSSRKRKHERMLHTGNAFTATREIAAAQPARKRQKAKHGASTTAHRKRGSGGAQQQMQERTKRKMRPKQQSTQRTSQPQNPYQKTHQHDKLQHHNIPRVDGPPYNITAGINSEDPCAEIGPTTGIEHKILVTSPTAQLEDGLRWRKYGQKVGSMGFAFVSCFLLS